MRSTSFRPVYANDKVDKTAQWIKTTGRIRGTQLTERYQWSEDSYTTAPEENARAIVTVARNNDYI